MGDANSSDAEDSPDDDSSMMSSGAEEEEGKNIVGTLTPPVAGADLVQP